MLRRLSFRLLLLPALAGFALGVSGCGSSNFESSADPYGGIEGGQTEVDDVEADLENQKKAAYGG